MTAKRSPWRGLHPTITGGKSRVYAALQEMPSNGEVTAVYFRRADLSKDVGISPSQLTKILRSLQDEGYIIYRPGNPGMLSEVQPAPEPDRSDG